MDKKDRLRIPRTVASTAGTAVVAVLMLGVVTFGATTIRPLTAGTPADSQADEQATDQATAADAAANLGENDAVADEPRPGDEAQFRTKGHDTQADKATPEPTAEPTPKPAPPATPKPKPVATTPPAPAPTSLTLEGWTKVGKAKLGWSKYLAEGFSYYKLVRSSDGAASWPLGPGDSLVAAISDPYAPYAADAAPCGTPWFYRVFAVKATDGGYQVLAASNTVQLVVPCAPEPPAEPSPMAFEVVQTDAGVQLTWEKCGSESFAVYKVVRSATDADPMYPLHDGDELLAAIGDQNVTGFVDGNVAPGQTWTYRVLALGEGPDGWVVLGLTAATTITVQ